MKSLVCILAVLMILSLSVACAGPGATPTVAQEPDYWPTEGWKSSTPEAQGMGSEQLARMFEYIEEKDVNLHSLLIVRNGYLVTEAYLAPYDQATYTHVHSISAVALRWALGLIATAKIGSANM